MTAAVLATGEELIRGDTPDTNFLFITRALADAGCEVRAHETVGDGESDIAAALRRLARRADFVVVTGGLGPTRDDRTRQAAARLLRRPLRLHAPSLRRIQAWLRGRGRELTAANRIQAMIPAGARVLPNPVGTAPGFLVRIGRSRIAALPGVPHEMRRMLGDHVVPLVRRAGGRRTWAVVRKVGLTGISEARVDLALDRLGRAPRDVEIGMTVSAARVTVAVTVRRADRASAVREAGCWADRIRRLFPGRVYGTGGRSLEAAVLDRLARRGGTLALAESCTGGLLGARLTAVPGASRVLVEGITAYANAAKVRRLGVPRRILDREGAVSAAAAAAMARGARRSARTGYALAITGVAGPGGGTRAKPVGTVFVALDGPAGTRVVRERFRGDREHVRERSVTSALTLLWDAIGDPGQTPVQNGKPQTTNDKSKPNGNRSVGA